MSLLSQKIRQSLTVQVTVILSTIMLFYVCVVVVTFMYSSRSVIETTVTDMITLQATSLGETSKALLKRGYFPELEDALEKSARMDGIDSIRVYDPRRNILVDSDPYTMAVYGQPVTDELSKAGQSMVGMSRIENDLLTIIVPLQENGRAIGVLELKTDVSVALQGVRSETRWHLLLSISFFIFGWALISLFFDRLLRSVKQLIKVTKAASDGDYVAEEIAIDRDDEIGTLAKSFAALMRSLQESRTEIKKINLNDSVTGLPNRKAIEQKISMSLSANAKNRTGALIAIDIDQFSRVNETLGQHVGDDLLRSFADRVSEELNAGWEQLSDSDEKPTLARTSGDEFLAFLPSTTRTAALAALAQRIMKAVEPTFAIDEHVIRIRCSIGIALLPSNGHTYAAINKAAGLALRHSKKEGGNRYTFFADDMDEGAKTRLWIESEILPAIDRGEFELFYQPKIDCQTLELRGAEALIRWNHPQRNMISPGNFIPVAEETGLIVPLGEWVIEEACWHSKRWMDAGVPLRIAINLSLAQLEQSDFLDRFDRCLAVTGADPQLLEVEITESMAVRQSDVIEKRCAPLREMGIKIAVDDFGTGYSSLSSLTMLQVDSFKIDRSFIFNLEKDIGAEAIIRLVIALAKQLNCETVAEGIETEKQLQFLRDAGCDIAQGFFIGKPMKAALFDEWRSSIGPDGKTVRLKGGLDRSFRLAS